MNNKNHITTESSVCNWDAKISLEIIEKTWEKIRQQKFLENSTQSQGWASSISTSIVLDDNNNDNNSDSDSSSVERKYHDDSIMERNTMTVEATNTLKLQQQQEEEPGNSDAGIKKQEQEEEENNITISTTSSSTSSDQQDDDNKSIINEETDAYRIRNEKQEDEHIGKSDVDVIASEANTSKDFEACALSLDQPSKEKEEDGKEDNTEAATLESTLALDNAPQDSHPVTSVVTTTASSLATTTSTITNVEDETSTPSTTNNKNTISKVMDHTCSIFPTTFKLAATTATTATATTSIPAGATTTKITTTTSPNTSHTHPFITLHPAYISSISGEDLICAFDEIMATAFKNTNKESDEQFPFVPSGPISDSWMDLLRAYATKDNNNNNDLTPQATMPSEVPSATASESTPSSTISIPLYMLIVFRFQLSLVESYLNRPQSNFTSIATTATQEQAAGHDLDHSKLLPSLISRVRELEEANPSKTGEVLSKLRSKFPEIFSSDQSEAKNRIEDYLLVPLKVVAERLFKTVEEEEEERPKVLQSIDLDIESSLPVEWYGDYRMAETVVELSNNGETFQSTPEAEASPEHPKKERDNPVAAPTTGGKKKKKKNKKKVSLQFGCLET
jgi:hypothetical protein